jgi:chemotaxis protein methyltransferase CheR
LVLCRNLVFTYFDEATQRSVLPRIARHIVPGGILVIGKSEALPAGRFGLECRDEKLKIFQKAPTDLRV